MTKAKLENTAVHTYTRVFIRDEKENRILEVPIETTRGYCEAAAKGWAPFKDQPERYKVCGVE